MIPLVMSQPELDTVKARIEAVAEAVMHESGEHIDYQIGTMIELPRAALRAGEIAASAEFFSFGTNDLTQTTLGISRDDAASFLGTYVQQGLLEHDPFVTIDQDGVGRTRGARRRARTRDAARHQARHLRRAWRRPGFDRLLRKAAARTLRLLLSPYRVPIARLAAAQAALAKEARSLA